MNSHATLSHATWKLLSQMCFWFICTLAIHKLRKTFRKRHFSALKDAEESMIRNDDANEILSHLHWSNLPLITGFPHLLENLEKWEYTWKTWKNHGILQKIIKIMEKLHGTWKNIWVDYKSLHARGRPQVLCVCLLSGGWNKCSILCMHWNGPRVNLNCQTCVHITHLKRGKVGSSVWPERSVRGLWGRGRGLLQPPCVPPLQQGGHPLVVEGDK